LADFNDSPRGLSVGAPVTLLGLEVGEVTDVGFKMDPETLVLRGRVEFVAYPERLVAGLRTAEAEKMEQVLGNEQRSHVRCACLPTTSNATRAH
jgi:paraquat-inducible protein B